MALPCSFSSVDDYFRESLGFLKQYQWLYNYPNTHILSYNVLDSFPDSWKIYLKRLSCTEFSNLLSGKIDVECPESLKVFVSKVVYLKPNHADCLLNTVNVESVKIRKKKAHEIALFAPLINSECKKRNIECIVDVGVGIGYLPELLHDQYKYKILGLEGDAAKVQAATKRQSANKLCSRNCVKIINHFVTNESTPGIQEFITEMFSENDVAMIGLHACADLSTTVLKIFLQLNSVKLLIIMPCCYHRLKLLDATDSSENFENFPISSCLKELHEDVGGNAFLRRYFLRLACQQNGDNYFQISDADRAKLGKNLLYRAVLEDCAKEAFCEVKRTRRKSGLKSKNCDLDFENYVNCLKDTHRLSGGEGASNLLLIDSAEFKGKLLEKWGKYKECGWIIESLCGFQASIQSVCENLVLLDRVQFLREMGVRCYVRKVTDERLSPRCYALVAAKD